ncbi:MAG: LamG domain-containing protein [Gammaproteobacteria bacterium]|nr:LamG domain-containing protein [Gammaproteobacteria bacterium]
MKNAYKYLPGRCARWIAIAVTSIILVGCGGGADTEALPQLNLPAVTNYTGDPPASDDVQAFMLSLWANVARPDRCGGCHSEDGGQAPLFARGDDVNLAYDAVLPLVNLSSPSDSRLVVKVGGGHNCWEAVPDVCATIMTGWIADWGGASTGAAARTIDLEAPVLKDVGNSKTFPADASLFATTIHPLLTANCSNCHSSSAGGQAQTPFFADADPDAAYDAVRSKIDLDDPASSRLVVRLRSEFHNCWTNCSDDANSMQTQIETFAGSIVPTSVDPDLVISKALALYDGLVASGGNRYEANQIALWEFKTGAGTTAFDTSGVDPAINLTLSGDVEWVGGWGINVKSGKAQGSTSDSKKLHDMIKASGEYSIEAWVVPGNVAQEESRIVSYSAGTTARNFHLGQTLYAYDYYNRSSETDGNGEPFMQTDADDEDLQATLQHVVATYDPIDGRRVYVNGVSTDDVDPVAGGTLNDWDDTFAFVLGNEVSGDRQFAGVFRQVAIHNRAMTEPQILQNFDGGVGEKFFLLFYLSDVVAMPDAYLMFEVSQFDSYSYLFKDPVFISLDQGAMPGSIPIAGMRIGINGAESPVSQAYVNLNTTITDASYDPATGQALSDLGTIIGLEKGPASDEFFLSFEVLADETNVVTEPSPLQPTPVDGEPAADIGVRTFDEINLTMSNITTVPTTNSAIAATFDLVKTQLPTIEDIATFSAAHEIGIAQLAIQYCDELVEDDTRRTSFFGGTFDFNAIPSVAFAGANRDLVLNPLIDRTMNVGLSSQPDFASISDELGYMTSPRLNLIDRLIASDNSGGQRTRDITKAVCAAVIGSGVMAVQ